MRGGWFVRFVFQSAGVTVPTIRKQLATFGATGVKVGVKGIRTTGASIDLAFSDQRVAVILASGIDRPAADYALGHRSVPKAGPGGPEGTSGRPAGAIHRVFACCCRRYSTRAKPTLFPLASKRGICTPSHSIAPTGMSLSIVSANWRRMRGALLRTGIIKRRVVKVEFCNKPCHCCDSLIQGLWFSVLVFVGHRIDHAD